jgi:hypothetical protein
MKRFIVSILLVGCGGNGSIPIDDLGLELSVAACAKQWDCCTDAEIMEQYMGIEIDGRPITTEQDCVDFTNALFSGLAVAQYKASIEAGRVEYDGEAAADCVAAVDDVSCKDYASDMIDDDSACRPFLIPLVADGGACTQDFECKSDNCVDGAGDADGTCQALPGEGQPCDDNCADGTYCGYENSSEVCLALKADGAVCILDRECASDYCDDTTDQCGGEPLTCDGR